MTHRPDVVVIDHAYHRQTASSRFFFELLADYRVHTLYHDIGPAALLQQLQQAQAAAVVFFQIQPKPKFLRALRHPNVSWVPMRDDLRYDASRVRQLRGSNVKLLNFCQEAHATFSARGQQSMAVQFWPPVQAGAVATAHSKPRLFLWDRGYMQWPCLKQLIGEQAIGGVLLRLAPDPGRSAIRPDADDIRRYNIEIVEGWLSRDDYLAHLRQCNIFVAPRPLEGIGMALLEAMSLGLAILAPQRPTMDEYVQHGKNGWLFQPDAPRPLAFNHWAVLGQQAQQDCAAGAQRWAAQRSDIASFILTPPTQREKLWWTLAAGLNL